MKKSKLVQQRDRFGYFFISPYLIGLVLWVIIPLIEAVRISFSDLSVDIDGYILKFTGINNYSNIFTVSTSYRKTLLSSFSEMFLSVPVVIIFSFFIASILTTKFKGRGVVRTIAFLPVIITSGAIDNLLVNDYMTSTAGSTITGSAGTTATSFLSVFGETGIPDTLVQYISSAVSGIYDIVVLSAVPVVIFIAALNNISESIFEAAYAEGATKWEIFWKIKFPLSSPQILTSVVYCVIDNLNKSSNVVIDTIKTTIYKNWEYGKGAAMAFSYMLIIFIIMLAVYKFVSRFVIYNE